MRHDEIFAYRKALEYPALLRDAVEPKARAKMDALAGNIYPPIRIAPAWR
jgi:hypothetical protein